MANAQQEQPEDYIISTGRMETARTFVGLAAKRLVGINVIIPQQ